MGVAVSILNKTGLANRSGLECHRGCEDHGIRIRLTLPQFLRSLSWRKENLNLRISHVPTFAPLGHKVNS